MRNPRHPSGKSISSYIARLDCVPLIHLEKEKKQQKDRSIRHHWYKNRQFGSRIFRPCTTGSTNKPLIEPWASRRDDSKIVATGNDFVSIMWQFWRERCRAHSLVPRRSSKSRVSIALKTEGDIKVKHVRKVFQFNSLREHISTVALTFPSHLRLHLLPNVHCLISTIGLDGSYVKVNCP